MKYQHKTIIIFCMIVMAISLVPGQNRVALAGEELSNNLSEPDTTLSTSKMHKRAAGRLTLARAKKIALKNNPTLASAMERINQARTVITQAKADYFPTVSATTGMDYTEKTENASAGYEENQYINQVSATQILFNGFYRKYATLSAQYKEKMSLAARKDAERLLSWSVAQAFLNTQLAVENIKIAQADMTFNQQQETEAIAKEKFGTGSYSDVLNFKTKVNSAKSSLLSSQQDLNASIHGLAALLGYKDACLPDGMTISVLTQDPQDKTSGLKTVPKLESQLEPLVSRRPDIEEATLAVQDAKANIQMTNASYFPTISLTGAYGITSGDTLHDTDSMGASLGVNISFDIFSGGAKKAKVRQALAEKREKENDLLLAKISAISDIKTSAQKIVTTQQQLALQVSNTRLIETARDLVQKEFNAGLVSLVRLNEAQTDLVTAMGDLAKIKVSLVLALEELDYYIGTKINPV